MTLAPGSLRLACVAATLTLAGIAAGRGSAWLLAGAVPRVPSPALAPATLPPEPTPDACALLARPSLFGSALGIDCVGPPAGPSAAPPDRDAAAPPCPATLRLVGAVVPRGAASAPFAAITDGTGASLLYAEGMRVGERRVVAIARDEVRLSDGAHECRLTMFRRAPAPEGSLARPSTQPPPDAEVVPTGPDSFRVSRALVERLVSSGELVTTLRAIPHTTETGAVDGFRLFGIRAGSVAARLGIANGDALTHVDDIALTDAGAALDALTALRQSAHATLRVIRRGQPITLRYVLD